MVGIHVSADVFIDPRAARISQRAKRANAAVIFDCELPRNFGFLFASVVFWQWRHAFGDQSVSTSFSTMVKSLFSWQNSFWQEHLAKRCNLEQPRCDHGESHSGFAGEG
jgi:hypothetical protein